MAQRPSKQNRRSRQEKARRRRPVAGLVSAAGAFLGAAMTPLVTAPVAQGDEFDLVIEPIINSIAGSVASLVDPLAGLDSVSGADALVGLDMGGLGSPATDL